MYEQTMNNDLTLTGGENPLLAGRYQVVRQLGTGGMGSVWLAEDRQLDNKLFAVKMLPAILVSNKRAYRQLKDEALVAMKLVHPNIVQIRAFEENNGNPFLVMDYVEGQTLDDYLAEKGKLTEDETVRLLKPIASALDYAHGEGVVHRDVKPANVMIRKDGHPYILDFGIAREIQETMTRVTGKLSSGTLIYMSPEQLNGEAPKPAQDIYSFAAMAYECLKGEPPFSRGNIEFQIVNKVPEPLNPHNAISELVVRGLAKKAEDRPMTCVTVLEEDASLGDTVAMRNKDYHVAHGERGLRIPIETYIQYESPEPLSDFPRLGASATHGCAKSMGKQSKTCSSVLSNTEQGLAMPNAYTRHANLSLGKLLTLVLIFITAILCGYNISTKYEEFVEERTEAAQVMTAEQQMIMKEAAEQNAKNKVARLEAERKANEFRRLAEHGDVNAQYSLGEMYYFGSGVRRDYQEALKWYSKASEQGHALAQIGLGWMYFYGRGVPEDTKEALNYFLKAAEQGHVGAQSHIGWMYCFGQGVQKNYQEALKWFRKAAEGGNTYAQSIMGLMYREGWGVGVDYRESVRWYRKAAEQGDVASQESLGGMYENGQGVDKDLSEAAKWYGKSAERGNTAALEKLKKVREIMDKESKCN